MEFSSRINISLMIKFFKIIQYRFTVQSEWIVNATELTHIQVAFTVESLTIAYFESIPRIGRRKTEQLEVH